MRFRRHSYYWRRGKTLIRVDDEQLAALFIDTSTGKVNAHDRAAILRSRREIARFAPDYSARCGQQHSRRHGNRCSTGALRQQTARCSQQGPDGHSASWRRTVRKQTPVRRLCARHPIFRRARSTPDFARSASGYKSARVFRGSIAAFTALQQRIFSSTAQTSHGDRLAPGDRFLHCLQIDRLGRSQAHRCLYHRSSWRSAPDHLHILVNDGHRSSWRQSIS